MDGIGVELDCLELRKVDNPNTLETIQLDANSIHLLSLLPKIRQAL